MTEMIIWKTVRYLGILVVTLAMAFPVQVAHADGGRDPSDVEIRPRANQPAPVLRRQTTPAPAPAPATSTVTATPQSPAAAAAAPPQPRQQRRAPRPQIVETAPSGQPPAGESRFISNEVIVRFQLSSTEGARRRAIDGLGISHLGARTFVLAGVTVHRYLLPSGVTVQDAIERLEASAAVVNAQPNYRYVLQQNEEVTKLPQFGNDRIALQDAHVITTGGKARIAVIDTAVDMAHAELSDAKLAVFDVTGGGLNTDPHGTSIAGILAAGAKLTGVAPDAEIIGIAAFSNDASGTTLGNTWTVLDGTNVAFEQGADILNMSFAGPADPLLERAMTGARRLNILPIAAAGNEGPQAATLFPAGYEAVIAVTATDPEDNIYSSANIGAHVDIAAPGVDLLVLGNASGFRTSTGTSMAAAYISGIAALALSANPNADYDTLRTLLETGTVDLGAPGKDSVFGAGLASAALAVSARPN